MDKKNNQEITYLLEDKYGNIFPLRETMEFKFAEVFDIGSSIEILAHNFNLKSCLVSVEADFSTEDLGETQKVFFTEKYTNEDKKSCLLTVDTELFFENVIVSRPFFTEKYTNEDKKSCLLTVDTEFFFENVIVVRPFFTEKYTNEDKKSCLLTVDTEFFFEDWFVPL